MSETIRPAEEAGASARLQHDIRLAFLVQMCATGMSTEEARGHAEAWEAFVLAGGSELDRDARDALVTAQLKRGYTACAYTPDRAAVVAEAAHWVCLPLEADPVVPPVDPPADPPVGPGA